MVSYLLLFHVTCVVHSWNKSLNSETGVMCNKVGKNKKKASEILVIFWKVVRHNAVQHTISNTHLNLCWNPASVSSQSCRPTPPSSEANTETTQDKPGKLNTAHFWSSTNARSYKINGGPTPLSKGQQEPCIFSGGLKAASWLMKGVQTLVPGGFVQVDGVSG